MNSFTKKTLIAAVAIAFAIPQLANSHFVWIAKDLKTGETKVYFGEGPEPDQKMFLKGISKIKLSEYVNDEFTHTSFTEKSDGDDGWFVCNSQRNPKEVVGDVAYGLFSRDDSSMFLHYSGKYGALEGSTPLSSKAGTILPLDIAAKKIDNKLEFHTTFRAKIAPACEVTIVDPSGESVTKTTDENGKLSVPAKTGRYLIRAKVVDPTKGKHNGKSFSETRFYCTLVLDVGRGRKSTDETTRNTAESSLSTKDRNFARASIADIPVGVTSFGGAIANNKLYIYGGHTGKPHSYYNSGQNDKLYSIDLSKPSKWEIAGKGIGLQGLAMVSHQDRLYRIGGFHAHNKEGEKHDLRSVKDFAVYDSDNQTWKQLEPMPSGRSSFDAVVVGGVIYVVGGWEMNGKDGTQWCDTALSFDLTNKNAKWQMLPQPPFKRRALSVGFQNGKLIVIGGMQEKGGPTKKVALYNLSSNEWSDGPELPGDGRMEGFGNSCFNVGGELIVSTYSGNVCKLSADFSQWQIISTCDEGRFFHRLLALNPSDFILVGGASMETGKFYDVEVHSKK